MKQYVCTSCNYVGQPGKKKRGSGKVEMVCWALFPLGIPYSIWRMMAKINVCKQCQKETVVDSESAVGVRLIEKLDEELLASIAGAPGSSPVIIKSTPKPTPTALTVDPLPARTRPSTPNYDPNW